MTNRRKGVRSREFEKKQKIRTRLIEISLKVENLIYNKVPITEKEAEIYMKEVNSYRHQSMNDERTLQVIEKLSRCMKAIIAEQEELNVNYNHMNLNYHIREDSASPVYSLPDEDRTQFTQNEEESIADSEHFGEKSPILDFESQFTQDIIIDNNNKNTSPNIRNTQTAEYNLIAVNDSNELIFKTKQDEAIPNTFNNDDYISMESSPSILNNSNNNFHVLMKPVIPNGEDIHTLSNNNELIQSNFIFKSKKASNFNTSKATNLNEIEVSITTNVADVESPLTPINNMKKAISQNSKIFRNNFSDEVIKNSDMVSHPTIKEGSLMENQNKLDNHERSVLNNSKGMLPPKKLREIRIVKKGTIHVNDNTENTLSFIDLNETDKKPNDKLSKHHEIDVDHNIEENYEENLNTNASPNNTKDTTKVKRNIKPKKAPTAIGENIDNVKKTNNIKKKSVPRKKKLVAIKDTDHKTKKDKKANFKIDGENKTVVIKHTTKQSENQNNIIDNKISVPIYNENVVNDLSWLENIRYVREIAEDEYDRTILTDENFWDNYCLPANFDENDFL